MKSVHETKMNHRRMPPHHKSQRVHVVIPGRCALKPKKIGDISIIVGNPNDQKKHRQDCPYMVYLPTFGLFMV